RLKTILDTIVRNLPQNIYAKNRSLLYRTLRSVPSRDRQGAEITRDLFDRFFYGANQRPRTTCCTFRRGAHPENYERRSFDSAPHSVRQPRESIATPFTGWEVACL